MQSNDGLSRPDALKEHAQFSLSDNFACDLPGLGVIAVQGADAESFLHGQLTSDVRALTLGRSQMSAYCSPKGRVLAVFRLFRHADGIYLLTPTQGMEALVRRLRLFVLRAKVSVEPVQGVYRLFGLAGEQACTRVGMSTALWPEHADAVARTDHVTLVRVPGLLPRAIAMVQAESMDNLDSMRDEALPLLPEKVWTLLDINAGLPTIYPQNADQFVPQMLNLHALDAVSFSKGCYPGQEIVARMQYLSKPKRRMYRVHLDAAALPGAGEELYAGSIQEGTAIGRIVMATEASGGGYAALAVIAIDQAHAASIRLAEAGTAHMGIEDLPYTVDAVAS